jgi:hypothetical protein
MANEQFTQLPGVINAQLTDIICAVQGYVSPTNIGISVQETLGQIMQLFQSNIIFTFAGNPNGNVAGIINNLCWDSVDKILYICTTAGSVATAVWVPVMGPLAAYQVIMGNGLTVAPSPVTITAGSNVSIVNSGGILTISATAGPSLGLNNVTTPTFTMSSNNAYLANDPSSLVTLTLPTAAAFGTYLSVVGQSADGWSVVFNAGQNIIIGSAVSTATTGSVSSTNRYDSMQLVCTVANTTWTNVGGVQGNLTIV